MRARIVFGVVLAVALVFSGAMVTMAQSNGTGQKAVPSRPKGPCDIYAAAGTPCVGAYSTTRAMYASYNGPLYQIQRQSDGKTLDIGVVQPGKPSVSDAGGYADAAAQDAFCADTYCWITEIYDQSPKHNNLTQAPRGAWSGPAMGGMDNLPIASMAPVMVMGHKVYGVFIEPGMGLRDNAPKDTAVGSQAESMYWVVNGKHFNSLCCYDFGNAEIDSHDDGAGTMETSYFGDKFLRFRGYFPGPWIMTDQENNLVGCAHPNASKLCAKLPSINWHFVTAIAEGELNHWRTMGGNAKRGELQVMFNGPRINFHYDPMRKQGAIVLGDGGDNSNYAQGTFYEGAMTAAGTFPTMSTEQKVQANIVAAKYHALPVSIAPASQTATPPGVQTFSPESTQRTTVTFTNTTGAPARDVRLSIRVPNQQWNAVALGSGKNSVSFTGPVAPGASVSGTFKVTSGPTAWNGDLVGNAQWTNTTSGREASVARSEKVRNVAPVRINEFRIGTRAPVNATNSFIELYNAGTHSVNISNWTLTERPTRQAIFSRVKIPAGTKLAAGGFYLLGLANSGLAAPARAGDRTIYVRSTAEMKVGETVRIGTGSQMEIRKIVKVGTAASYHTTLWEPLPHGPILRIPAGSTNVPVKNVSGFVVGQKIALGYGATYPTVPEHIEHYELATVTKVGKPGTYDYLAVDAPAGVTNIKVTSVKNISVGDKIKLDIDSVGHGMETVTVTKVGRPASRTELSTEVNSGATKIKVGDVHGFRRGDKLTVGTPANWETVTITGVGTAGPRGSGVRFSPALTQSYPMGDRVVDQGTGLELAAPLRFNHSANLPFTDRGTGISFQPATAHAHMSDEPIQALGTGITLGRPLARNHAVNAVVRDVAVKHAGYQGKPQPNQWFGGPVLYDMARTFRGRTITVRDGSMVLRNDSGLVVDSLNYGRLVDPWAAEGYQGKSGIGQRGCYVTTPGLASGGGVSAGRFPDGFNTDSNCNDFVTTPVTILSAASRAGAKNIKVASVAGFDPAEKIRIGEGRHVETAVVAKVGTAGAAAVRNTTRAGATVIPVTHARGFQQGQTITIGSGSRREMEVVVKIHRRFHNATIEVATPLTHSLVAGEEVSGTGITLGAPLLRRHARGSQVRGGAATPGAAN